MTNILVPTDFNPASLQLAEAALKNGDYNRCNIVLFHAFASPDSPFDLLGQRPQNPAAGCMTEAFRQACKQLKDDYPQQVNKIIVRTMQGDTRNLFRNFLEANDIDLIYCLDSYRFSPVHARSLNPVPLFSKCGVPVVGPGRRRPAQIITSPVLSPVRFSTQ